MITSTIHVIRDTIGDITLGIHIITLIATIHHTGIGILGTTFILVIAWFRHTIIIRVSVTITPGIITHLLTDGMVVENQILNTGRIIPGLGIMTAKEDMQIEHVEAVEEELVL